MQGLALVALSITLTACVSYSRPTVPVGTPLGSWSEGQAIEVVSPVWKMADPNEPDRVDSEEGARLVEDLRATGMFADVRLVEANATSGGLVAIGGPLAPRCWSEPLLPMLTLFVIPNITCADVGYTFTVRGAPLTSDVRIDTSEKISAVIGWIAPLLSLLPSRTASFPREEELAALRVALRERLGPALSSHACLAAATVASKAESWSAFKLAFERSCGNDGAWAELQAEGATRLLAHQWSSLAELRTIAVQDPVFVERVLRLLGDAIPADEGRTIYESATNACPTGCEQLCTEIAARLRP